MSAMEESLRRALQGGDAADPEFRLSIYQASERALEKMLTERSVAPQEATARRHALANAIAHIETQYGSADDEGLADALPPARHEGHAGGPADFALDDAPDVEEPPARRHGKLPLPALIGIGAVILLVIILYAASTIFQGGSQTPVGTEGGAEQTGAADAPTELSWINVFSGGNIETLATPAGGRVEAISAHGREAVRMQAAEGQPSEVLLSVGPGLVGEIAGSTVRVELTAGSPDTGAREFSVRCLFADASVCDRQRFVTSMQEEAFVFDVDVPQDAGSPASLAIAPGVGGDGVDIDLYSVRMRVLG